MNGANRIAGERGFTLIELLVVILIIGILAAIALPAFLGQRTKSEDASAKTNARNAMSEIETCFAGNEQSYLVCDDSSELGRIGFPVGTPGAYAGADCTPPEDGVCVNARQDEFRVIARSKSGNLFRIDHADHRRTCAIADLDHPGGCDNGSGGATGSW